MPYSHPNKGFAILSVMLLVMMASVLVAGSLKDNFIQERLSGNFHKKMNSRHTAEMGVLSIREEVENMISANPYMELDDFVEAIAANPEMMSDTGLTDHSKYSSEIASVSGDIFTFKTQGSQFEGRDTLSAVFKFVPGNLVTYPSPFATGLTGCDGVVLGGSGEADSYNSADGAYGGTNVGDAVTVSTVSDIGVITIKGGADIQGDVKATSNVIFGGSASISGNLSTNGYVDITSASSFIGGNISALDYVDIKNTIVGGTIQSNSYITLSQVVVGGDVISSPVVGSSSDPSNVSITGETIYGGVFSKGNVFLNNTIIDFDTSDLSFGVQTYGNYIQTYGRVDGGVRVIGDVSLPKWGTTISGDNLLYAGTGSFIEHTNFGLGIYHETEANLLALFDVIEPLEEIPFDDGSGAGDVQCDPLNIDSQMSDINDDYVSNGDLFVSGSGSGDVFVIGETSAEFTRDQNSTSQGSVASLESVKATFLSLERDVIMVDSVAVKGHIKIADNSDVVWFIKGDFEMGGQSTLTIPDGSSLMIIIQGSFTVGAGGEVYTPDVGLTDPDKLPVLSIFSDYVGDGIAIQGGSEDIYAAVYAPKTDVTVTSSADFMGAILGKTVSVTGSGAFHYDAYLGESVVGPDPNNSSEGKFQFLGFQYL
ncbi:DUF7305 domain-containing protein [Pseudoalteromonas piratica]|uniref:DUF7305 domain-containing protein n=1 Tax=Pseudoalteromonas piratica TaxID=1348114 RepID=A0A0A7EDK3_9GAMM|nr:hypothetical protein [Pseudoalteromonas piratica]AIY64755.1 hypothetical protein OM33_06050 [Pseudoalteromonas piratica]